MTGSEENATMLNPTVRDNLLFPSSSPSARRTRRFPQVQSMVADAANYLRIYKERVFWYSGKKLKKNLRVKEKGLES
ncbi:hypothetical protein [Butyrivibrio sp.]|uniref:hypothetical protein n=1 Tax=Butyrivibrio sp. TaxID=28121 RepID=UPI0025BD244B|nr:hypothetical protein [Butyrivibrio sp.]MBQ9304764.1 hypothetical protein [Butyrivibrio sp.]